MKGKKIALFMATILIVGVGSFTLGQASVQVKHSVAEELSGSTQLAKEEGNSLAEIQKDSQGKIQENNVHFLSSNQGAASQEEHMEANDPEGKNEQNSESMEEKSYQEVEIEEMHSDPLMGGVTYLYSGQQVVVRDILTDKTELEEIGNQIMDYVWDYVDKTLFSQYGVDKTQYIYVIRRQIEFPETEEYCVMLMKGDRLDGTIGVKIDEEVILKFYTMDGLVLEGSKEYEISLLEDNTKLEKIYAQKETLYQEYYEKSKDLIENVLKLAAISDESPDLENSNYFSVGDAYPTVTFGYKLEDGTFVKVFYCTTNQKLDGFVIN